MDQHQINKMILKQQLSTKYASAVVLPNTGVAAKEELKWINYIPEHWKPSLEKNVSELTQNDISIL